MKSFERGGVRESIDKVISSVAHAYGFSNPPIAITRKDTTGASDDTDQNTILIAALAGKMGQTEQTTQAWGVARNKGNSSVVFAVSNPQHAIAQAFVIQAVLQTALSSGLESAKVLVSSVGDNESQKRYLREIGNFFKKNAKDVPEELYELSQKDPEEALTQLKKSENPLANSAPRTIDYLSESSRKIMLETISLLESLEIQYELSNEIPYTPGISKEIVFAIQGVDKKGNTSIVASGGRYEEDKKNGNRIVGMAVSVPETLGAREMPEETTPTCFVVHVGEAAKLKAFSFLNELWDAHVTLNQALLASSIQDQMEIAKASGAKYIAIVGQREALDGTCILKNTSTQLQETLPAEKVLSKLARVR